MNQLISWIRKKWLIVITLIAMVLLYNTWLSERIQITSANKFLWEYLKPKSSAFSHIDNGTDSVIALKRNSFLIPSADKIKRAFDFVSNNLENLCNTTKRMDHDHLKTLKTVPIKYTRSRIGVIMHIPIRQNNYYVVQFTTFIYASWKQITTNAFEMLLSKKDMNVQFNLINLLVFCEGSTCRLLPDDCFPMDALTNATDSDDHLQVPGCYFLQTKQFDHVYKYANSFAFINVDCMPILVARHDYFMRTDLDTFLSPAMLTYKFEIKQGIITGKGGYCTTFTTERLKQLAKRRGIKHQGVHCLGSTWFGHSNLIYRLSMYAAQLSMDIHDTEFDWVEYPELKPFFQNSKIGKWPEWYQPVSLLYGQELAVNGYVDGLSYSNVRGDLLDSESCRQNNILKHLHVHTWHSDCEFQKFRFLDKIVPILKQQKPITFQYANIVPTIGVCLSVRDYCTYVAWNGLNKNVYRLLDMD